MSYDDYLRSEHWQDVRRRFYANRPKRKRGCYCCKREDVRLNLHHKTYERIGREQLDDLVPLCDACHTHVHRMLEMAKTSKGTGTRRERKMWRKLTLGNAANLLRKRIAKRQIRGARWEKTNQRIVQRRYDRWREANGLEQATVTAQANETDWARRAFRLSKPANPSPGSSTRGNGTASASGILGARVGPAIP